MLQSTALQKFERNQSKILKPLLQQSFQDLISRYLFSISVERTPGDIEIIPVLQRILLII